MHPDPPHLPGRRIRVVKGKWRGPATSVADAALVVAAPGRIAWRSEVGTERQRPRRGTSGRLERAEVGATSGGWWVATRVDGPAPRWKIDAVTPPRLGADGVLRFTDLDLDLEIGPGRRIAVRDLGQMLRRAVAWRYPPRVVACAVLGLSGALLRRAARRWPFDGSLCEAAAGGDG